PQRPSSRGFPIPPTAISRPTRASAVVDETQCVLSRRLAPQVPVFLSSHVHLLPSEHWQRYRAVCLCSKYWRTVLDYSLVNLVVEPAYTPNLCKLLRQDQEWQVFADAGERQGLLIALRARPR